jgi:hypothetical protein
LEDLWKQRDTELQELEVRKGAVENMHSESQKTESEEAQLKAAFEAREKKHKRKSILPSLGEVVKSFSAKFTQCKESEERVTPVSFHSLEDFIEPIPGIQTQDRRGGTGYRGEFRRVVEEVVSSERKIQDPGDETWLAELVEHNHSGKDNRFIVKLLVEYALNRPWVLHDAVIERMMHSFDHLIDPKTTYQAAYGFLWKPLRRVLLFSINSFLLYTCLDLNTSLL